MAKNTSQPGLDGLRLCQRLVADHGDALRFSLSKKGRVWITLTHWDSEKYNTSVELDSMATVEDVLNAFAVVGVAHYAKCFFGLAHQDTWHGIEATIDLSLDSQAQAREYLSAVPANVDSNAATEAPGDASR